MKTPSHTCAALTRLMLAFSAAVVFLAASSSALAQQSATSQDPRVAEEEEESEAVELDPIALDPFYIPAATEEGYGTRLTATATRSVKLIMDVPAAIGIANRELLDDVSATFGYEAIKYAVSSVTRPQTNWDDSFIRGFRSVFALRDGVQTSLRTTNPLYDIERVEVIKGPTGMLIGHVSHLGGVINFVTKQPTDTPQGNVRLTLGSDEFVRFESQCFRPNY